MSNGFLSQEEINSLLNGELGNDNNNEKIDDNALTDNEKDMLGEIGNISMGSASTALYQIINQKVNITTPIVTLTTLTEIKETFETPNVVLDVEYTSGIEGRNILIIETKDAAIIANLMMGGDGKVDTNELSELEISAVSEAMNQMIGSAATAMATMFARKVDISPPVSRIWSDKAELISEKIPEDEVIVKVSFRMTVGDLIDSYIMQILPIRTAKAIGAIMNGTEEQEPKVEASKKVETEIEPQKQEVKQSVMEQIVEKPIIENRQAPQVEVHTATFEPLQQTSASTPPKNIDLILDVPLNISVVLGRTKKSIKDILALGTGSLIELEKLAEEPVEVLVNGKQIAYGEVVVVDENFGVRLTSIVSNADRIRSLK